MMEHSEIAELSNEKEETEQVHTKEDQKSSLPDSSHSNESDYVDEHKDKMEVKIAVCPAVDFKHQEFKSKETADIQSNFVHPFMLECVVEETRRKSSAIADRDMILSCMQYFLLKSYLSIGIKGLNKKDEDDAVSSSEFDENLLMFGGKKSNKVSVNPFISFQNHI